MRAEFLHPLVLDLASKNVARSVEPEMMNEVQLARQAAVLSERTEHFAFQRDLQDPVVMAVGKEQGLIRLQVEAPRRADMIPLCQELPIRIEDLHPVILTATEWGRLNSPSPSPFLPQAVM